MGDLCALSATVTRLRERLSVPANVLDHNIPMNCAIRAGLPRTPKGELHHFVGADGCHINKMMQLNGNSAPIVRIRG
jgi:hypothetical protein